MDLLFLSKLHFKNRCSLLPNQDTLRRSGYSLPKERISTYVAQVFSRGDLSVWQKNVSQTYGARASSAETYQFGKRTYLDLRRASILQWRRINLEKERIFTYSYELGSSSTESIWPNDVSRIKIIIMIMTYINNSRYLHFFFHF